MKIRVPNIEWSEVESAPPLEPGAAHVWQLPMEASESQLQEHVQRLSAEEQAQAYRFVRPELTRRFIMRRSLLRIVLDQYLQPLGTPLAFRFNNFGKPYLDGGGPAARILFNTSQTHEMALLAVCREHEIGIDVEYLRPISEFVQLGKRFFTSAEQQEILAMPEEKQLRAFFWIWTGKEAILKACGIGISTGLKRASIGIRTSGPHLDMLDRDLGDVRSWKLRGFVPHEDYQTTLATHSSIHQLQFLKCLI